MKGMRIEEKVEQGWKGIYTGDSRPCTATTIMKFVV
jgi:hypothetical protein